MYEAEPVPQADGHPGEDTPDQQDAVSEQIKDQEAEEDFEQAHGLALGGARGQVPTREALERELEDAKAQVHKLQKILMLDDETIHLFLGTERYL